ncbi:C-type lectin domain family 2 member A-like [Sorex araneus]|uniref:C-type lectin domain family 2 member A-like n=1 Tax=Sorex araneus TaxID=42254 RepID=UPI0024333A37|nr:C-type lectin domain family 2 member A-like [Sorex araneus]
MTAKPLKTQEDGGSSPIPNSVELEVFSHESYGPGFSHRFTTDVAHSSMWKTVSCDKVTKLWKKRCIVVSASLAILFVVICTAFAVIVTLKTPETNPCLGIETKEKCFNLYGETKNWTASKEFCHSKGSELAHIDTKEEMELLKNHTGTAMHWIGLSREEGGPWKWTNGTTFNDLFEIRGNGLFAFLNADGVQSSMGHLDLLWICSKSKM